jgi:glycosyltransferase involved in cell wall biosynthesis
MASPPTTEFQWRLALDVGPVHGQPAGVGTYAASLASGLSGSLDGYLALIGVRQGTPSLGLLDGIMKRPFRSPNYHSWLQLYADRQAYRVGAELVHYTNAAAPLGTKLPYILTVHDLSLVRLPHTHPTARLATVPIMLWSVAHARAVVVPSAWTRRELEHLPIKIRRIAEIPHAPAPIPELTEDEGGLLLKLGIGAGNYILAVGTLEPRKNLIRLIGAFERLAGRRADLRLVLAGAPGWRFQPILERARGSRFSDRILIPGYLTSSALAALTRASGAVAYVSVYEGFGMPVLDAMSIGAAVVASRRTAVPQAAGGAAVLVDPYDEADIARGLERALDRRDELVEAGRRRAALRTWADVAQEHIEVYRWAMSRPDD